MWVYEILGIYKWRTLENNVKEKLCEINIEFFEKSEILIEQKNFGGNFKNYGHLNILYGILKK